VIVLAEHFTQPPSWQWYILGYFFLAGLAGGSYVLGTLLRLWGGPEDEPTARIAFVAALVCLAVCPVLLTLDLGQPLRFWHMLVDSTNGSPDLKYWSPMSVGAYALLFCGLFFFFSGADAFLAMRGSDSLAVFRRGPLAVAWMVLGTIFGLFLAAYTGVLLSVSNQPVWSDTWALGGLFLASGLSGSAALLLLLARSRAARASAGVLSAADEYFLWLEALLVIVFLITVAVAGTLAQLFAPLWILLWILVLVGVALPLLVRYRMLGEVSLPPVLAPLLVLVGVLALRAVIIFGAQS
jgi:formate-dependent nitrite reductase membrane component NrfD